MAHRWSSDPKLNGKIRLEIPLTRLENSPPGPCSICSQQAKNWDNTTKLLVFSALANHLNQTSFLEDLVSTNELDQMINELSFCPNCMDFGRALFLLDKKLTAMLYEISQLTQTFREIMLSNCPSTDPKHIQDFKAMISKAPILHYVRRTTDYEEDDNKFKSGNFADNSVAEVLPNSTQYDPTTESQPDFFQKPLEKCIIVEESQLPPSPPLSTNNAAGNNEAIDELEEALNNPEQLENSKSLQEKTLFNLRPRNPNTRKWMPKRKFKKPKSKINRQNQAIYQKTIIEAKQATKCQKMPNSQAEPILPEVDKKGFQEMDKLGIPFKRAIIPISDLDSDSNKQISISKKSQPAPASKRLKRKKAMAKYQNQAIKKLKTGKIVTNVEPPKLENSKAESKVEPQLVLEKLNSKTPLCKNFEIKLYPL